MEDAFASALVTGGAGFIGSHVAGELAARGCRVKVLDDLSTGRIENLAEAGDGIEFHRGDIRDVDAVFRAARGCEVIFHLAAMVSVPLTVADPLLSADINIMGTGTVLEAARQQGCRTVVFASSCAVYGDDPRQPKTEEMATRALSPYALQKLTGEQHMDLFSRTYGLSTVSLRFFNVYGPRQDPSSPYSGVISIFMDRALGGKAPVIHGDGRQSRDFIYVQDIVRALLLAATSDAAGGVINVGSGSSVSISALWEKIGALAGVQRPARHDPPRVGDIRHSQADIALARRLLDFEPAVGLDDGLKKTLDWYRRAQ